MKMLLIADCYLPCTKSGAKLIHDLAVEFCNQGHDLIVAVPDAELEEPSKVSIEENITILRIRTGRIKGAGNCVRAINEIRLSSVMWKTGKVFFKKNPCDLIIYYCPSIFFGSLVRKLKTLWNCKSYLIQRDIFPQWAVDTGILRKGPVYWYFRYVEFHHHYDAADVIGVECTGNIRYFRENGIDKTCTVEVLHNWTTLDEENIVMNNDRERLGLQNKFVFFYGGNIGVAQDMDNILRLAQNLRIHSNIHFLLVGQGSEVLRLNKIIAGDRLTNITIHPPVSQEHYLGMLSQFDAGLISLDRRLRTYNFPGKMLGYMCFSLPILASVNQGNDLRVILESGHAGLVCLNGEDEQFRNNALQMASDSEQSKKMGQNARRVLEDRFTVHHAVSTILSHFELGN